MIEFVEQKQPMLLSALALGDVKAGADGTYNFS